MVTEADIIGAVKALRCERVDVLNRNVLGMDEIVRRVADYLRQRHRYRIIAVCDEEPYSKRAFDIIAKKRKRTAWMTVAVGRKMLESHEQGEELWWAFGSKVDRMTGTCFARHWRDDEDVYVIWIEPDGLYRVKLNLYPYRWGRYRLWWPRWRL